MSGAINGSYNTSVNVASQFKGEMNVPEMMMAIQLERSNMLDAQIKDQMNDMKKRNAWLGEANNALANLRAGRPAKEGDPATGYRSLETTKTDPTTGKTTTETVNTDKWLVDNGIEVKDPDVNGVGNQAEFDVAINNLKSAIDTVNSQSQMDMVRLQGLMDKRNQAFDLMTNTLSKSGKSLDSIIGNMR